MAQVYVSDILRLLANFEPSRAKMWEIARTFDSVQWACVIYAMENITLDPRRQLLSIDRYQRTCFCECRCDLPPGTIPPYDEWSCGGDYDYVLTTTVVAMLRLERAEYRYNQDHLWLADGNAIPSRNMPAWTCSQCGRHRRDPPPGSLYADRVAKHQLYHDHQQPPNVIDIENDSRPGGGGKRGGYTAAKDDDAVETMADLAEKMEAEAASEREVDYSDDRDMLFADIVRILLRQQNGISTAADRDIPLQGRIVAHNLATKTFRAIVQCVKTLLVGSQDPSKHKVTNKHRPTLVTSYLQFYRDIIYGTAIDTDPRSFRNLTLPSTGRFYDRSLSDLERAMMRYELLLASNDAAGGIGTVTETFGPDLAATDGRITIPADQAPRVRPPPKLADYIVQPLYQGAHVVVYTSSTELRCYNRFGELCPNQAYTGARTKEPCCFEAILLPVDENNNIRSWRYWFCKSDWVLYVVDVFRYGEKILTDQTYRERMRYIDRIVDGDRLLPVPEHLSNWDNIERLYESRYDVYAPVVGVVLRDPNSKLTPPEKRPAAFHFPIRAAFSLTGGNVLDMSTSDAIVQGVNLRQVHICYEMADYKTVVTVYGHCRQYLYLCRYNRALGQFVHAAKVARLLSDEHHLMYRMESIFVLHARTMPRGVLYLRLYYDRNGTVIGYEHKNTDGRFKVPLALDPLLMGRATVTLYEEPEPCPTTDLTKIGIDDDCSSTTIIGGDDASAQLPQPPPSDPAADEDCPMLDAVGNDDEK